MLTNCQINNFKLNRQIGSGAYGLVFHAVDLITENEYAIKAVVKGTAQLDSSAGDAAPGASPEIKRSTMLQTQLYYYFKSFQNRLFLPTVDLDSIRDLSDSQLEGAPHFREIAMHLRVHAHPNIVTVHQVLESPLATFMVLDYCSRDLFTSIVDHQYFAKNGMLVKQVFLQLCSVIQHCHARGIYHCDIKPENILLDEHDNVCMCDFGLSTQAEKLPANVCVGSSYYMAPERISCPSSVQNADNLTPALFPTWAGDIWSLGIILVNLTCIRNPWLKAHQVEDNTFSYFVKDSKVLLKILPVSQQLYEILSDILKLEPTARASLTDIMERVADCTSFTNSGPLSEVASLSDPQRQRFLINHRGLSIKQMLHNYHSDDECDRSYSQGESDTEVTSEEESYRQTCLVDSASTRSVDAEPTKQQSHVGKQLPFPVDFQMNLLTKNMSVVTNYSSHSRWLPQY
ncbi:LANO_0E10330g1_1 [Lachancea nothofagi CBS 11611]|uniref:non-specific serine/threonine protein kinase n=1 Tax=Lachancea nothofagi CBS 11611 TaxID=1266666 RepID=A0A1G4JWF3_9SACH|nr:LANO_0E10330g1_1 [Lachancea nothofagi CBS 11611]